MVLSRSRLPLLLAALVALGTTACASQAAPATTAAVEAPAPVTAAPVARSATLVLGSISNEPVEEVEEFQPLADALAARLAPAGVERVQVRVSASTSEMTRLVQTGEVDLYLDSPFPALTVARAAGGTAFLKRWKDGVADYRSVVFVRAESPVRTPTQLAGATLAFDEDVSTSGYFLPSLALMERGLRPVPLVDPPAPATAADVHYAFTGDEENVFFWVEQGRADAGAMAEHDLAELTAEDPDAVRVVLTSAPAPRHLVVHRRGLDAARVGAVRTALLGLDDDAAGRTALAEFGDTDRFEELTPGALESLTASVARFSAVAR